MPGYVFALFVVLGLVMVVAAVCIKWPSGSGQGKKVIELFFWLSRPK